MTQGLAAGAVITSFPPHAVAVTPSDSTEYDVPSTIYVGVAGDVAVTPAYPLTGATPLTFVAVPAGSVIPVLVKQVRSTGTTATSMVRIY